MAKKIDFHIHTIPSEKDYNFNYSSSWMREYVKEAELDAIAITNHDLFDEDNYQQVVSDIPDIKVFPGMELSLDKGHVNIIMSENEKEELKKFSEWIKSQNRGPNGVVTINELCEHLGCWEKGIYIFELKKSNSLKVPNELKNTCTVGGVSNQLRFQSVIEQSDSMTPVLFSDAHADENDTEKNRCDINILKNKNTYIQIDRCTFDEIRNAIHRKDKVGIEKDLLKKVITIDNHRVSTGLNLIVGKRGSGKTHFLELINKQFPQDELYRIAQFETANAEEYIEKQRKQQGELAFESWAGNYETQISAIKQYLTENQTNTNDVLEEYLKSIKKYANDMSISNSSQKYRLLSETKFESMSTKNIEDYLHSLKGLVNSRDLWKLLENKIDKRTVFIEIYRELREIYVKMSVENRLKSSTNDMVKDIQDILQKHTGISTPIDCEVSRIIKKQQIEQEIQNFLESIIDEKILTIKDIFDYKIVVKLKPFKNAEQFKNDFKTREAVKDDLIKPYEQKEYITFLKKLSQKAFFDKENLIKYFLHLEVELLDSDGTPASGGQAVGFTLMMRLEEAKNYPVVLIDEPEASLDNAYINEVLIDALRKMSKDSVVFVVTHNSTLGTLLEPDYLITTTKIDTNNYRVLTGEFTSRLISSAGKEVENSYDKFIEAMEAGFINYEKKGEIYETLRDK
ncbi:hypothetical protein [Aerococcus urinaeequi]|uniref:hypothetical protein n=1 Tax=Aerococcus urinaeequi TaxID=51665 RepID=UPI003D6B19A0